ncbi:MAG TPA: hypothetical protein VG820_13905 [Fimbriimonadaceae bacterium]|nr:hypothetical protein [Fimbriimonadaceae bacterium]
MKRSKEATYPPGSFGCAQFLIVPVIGLLGYTGYMIGLHWGTSQAICGLVAGVVLSAPVYGIALAAIAGIAWVVDRLRT